MASIIKILFALKSRRRINNKSVTINYEWFYKRKFFIRLFEKSCNKHGFIISIPKISGIINFKKEWNRKIKIWQEKM